MRIDGNTVLTFSSLMTNKEVAIWGKHNIVEGISVILLMPDMYIIKNIREL